MRNQPDPVDQPISERRQQYSCLTKLSGGQSPRSWLPKGFEFLSGLPEAARKRRYLMPVQAFVDDSGGKGQSRYFVSCGLVAHSDQWAAFSDEWRTELDAGRSVQYFKMREAAGFSGEFFGFSETQRNDKLLALARIINRYVGFVVFSSIDLDAHAKTWAVSVGKPLNEPYFWTFHNTINAACFELWDIGWREPFEIIFDEQVIFGPRAKMWYPLMRDTIKIREPEAWAIMPVDPMFKSDLEFLPIQACDLIAWCGRRDGENPKDRPFAWLDDVIAKPYVSDYSQFYDHARMQAVMDESNALLRTGGIPMELIQKYREYFE